MRLHQASRGWFALAIIAMAVAVAGCDRCRGCREYAYPAYASGPPVYRTGYNQSRYVQRDWDNRRPGRTNWNGHRGFDCD